MKPYDDTRGKREQVRGMFDGIAPVYDRLNHILSLGIDRSWRRRVVKMVRAMVDGTVVDAEAPVGSGAPFPILDLATGTADLAIAMARKIPRAPVTAADLSPGMLRIACEKVAATGLEGRITLCEAAAERLPFGDGSFGVVTVAFGVRNFEDMERGLSEIHRVLVPGGRLVVLEFSRPTGKILAPLYRFYSHRVLPAIGGLVSRDRRAYSYLPGSVDEFPARGGFCAAMSACGFRAVAFSDLTGGIATIYCGER